MTSRNGLPAILPLGQGTPVVLVESADKPARKRVEDFLSQPTLNIFFSVVVPPGKVDEFLAAVRWAIEAGESVLAFLANEADALALQQHLDNRDDHAFGEQAEGTSITP